MRYLVSMLMIFSAMGKLPAQTPTFNKDVAPIIYSNCTNCHRQGDIAPFVLETYSETVIRGASIKAAVLDGTMPPWPPDVTYSDFCFERTLTQEEINTIVEWVDGGMPAGDPGLKPPVPQFPAGSRLPGKPDMSLRIPLYESKAITVDEYACFPIPSGLTTDKFIRAIEVIPGNPAIVHHVIVFSAAGSETNCGFSVVTGRTLTGYAPGAPPTVFPSGDDLKLGMKLEAGSNILLQLHYPEGTAGEMDSTRVNFYFYPDDETGIREVVSGPYVMNWGIEIPPNTVKTFDAYYPYLANLGVTTSEDMSVFAVFPHMHKIGTTMTSFAVTSTNDTIPLVNVNHWDFEWQGFYTYKHMIKIPKGSIIYGTATYDNTANNHHNPFNPPQHIYAGEATTDEMLLISYQSLKYEPGDEDHNLEEMLTIPDDHTSLPDRSQGNRIQVTIYPNPTQGYFEITGWNNTNEKRSTITVADVFGKVHIYREINAQDGPVRLNLDKHPDGIYLITLQNGDDFATKKVVLIR